MSNTVRDLIRDAFIRSTVRGLGDTPDDLEVKDALAMLNEILDVLSQKDEFSTGEQGIVFDMPPGRRFVTFSDNPHRVFSATATPMGIYCKCGESHDLNVGDSVDIRIGGVDITTEVTTVSSFLEFAVAPDGRLSGPYQGSFKKTSEGPEYIIDFITPPPVDMYQVVGSGVGQIAECQKQFFYSMQPEGRWWFYEKGNMPYPRLHVSGVDRVMAVFPKPTFRNVTLDTDLTPMDSSARSAIKYRLAAEIASNAGFLAVEESLLKRYRNAFATFVRSRSQSASPLPDLSAPGYFRNMYYDIFTDGGGHATF